MTDAKKKGFLSKLFGLRRSPCCNVRIEEVAEEEGTEAERQRSRHAPCCGTQRPRAAADK